MCEGCQLKQPNFGLATEGQKRWCSGCAKAHAGAEDLTKKKCESCGLKKPNLGPPSKGKKRQCAVCARKAARLDDAGSPEAKAEPPNGRPHPSSRGHALQLAAQLNSPAGDVYEASSKRRRAFAAPFERDAGFTPGGFVPAAGYWKRSADTADLIKVFEERQQAKRLAAPRAAAFVYWANSTHVIDPTSKSGHMHDTAPPYRHEMAVVNEGSLPQGLPNLYPLDYEHGRCRDRYGALGVAYYAASQIVAGDELLVCYGADFSRGQYTSMCADTGLLARWSALQRLMLRHRSLS